MTDVPAAVRSALAERRSKQASVAGGETSTGRVAAGDLRAIDALAHQPAERRIGLVLRVDTSNEFADVLLVHSAPELATDRDAVVAADVASAPYDVVVQTDLRAAVWTLQLLHRVGHLDEQSLGAVKAVASDVTMDKPSPQLAMGGTGTYSGTRLAGPLDGRWSFKESEGAALRRLAADCTEALLDEGLVWRVDQHLLRPDLLDLADDPALLILELLHWLDTRPLSLSREDLELLLSAEALDPDSWAQFSDIGADVLRSVEEFVVHAATGVGEPREHEPRCLLAAAHIDLADPTESIDRIHYLGAKEPVAA